MKINLLPKEERPLRQFQVRWEFLVCLIGVLLLGAAIVFSWLEISAANRLSMAYEDALVRESLLQKQVQAVTVLRKELQSLEVKEKAYQDLTVKEGQSLTQIPTLFAHSIPSLWIEAVVWDITKVDLLGYTQDMTSLSSYLNYLNEGGRQAVLSFTHPMEGSDFLVFGIAVKGVGGHGSTPLH